MVSLTIRPFAIAVPLSALLASGAWLSSAPGFVEKSILVTVLDQSGAPIRDLKAAEFVVTEDGKRREVTGAELATERLFVSVIIDPSKPPDGDVDRTRDLRASLAGFVKSIHGASPSAEIALRSAGGVVTRADHSVGPIGARVDSDEPCRLSYFAVRRDVCAARWKRPYVDRTFGERGSKFLMSTYVQ